MILALAGNPNCGKTTLFNALTGANARTGNFPGVTVTRSESVCRARPEITLVDLPGVYALRPYSDEERVTRSYLLGGAADAVISIADATCPARSLYLTLQLLELGVPVVLALNVMDALRAGGGSVDTAGLARALGIPVVPVSAALGEGLDALLDAAVQAAHEPPPDPWRALVPGPVQTFCSAVGSCTTPLALMIVGVLLADSSIGKLLRSGFLYRVTLLRGIVFPLLFMLVLRLLPLDNVLRMGLSIIASCPSGSLAAVVARQVGTEETLASQAVAHSTLCMLVTVPAMLMLAGVLFPL